MRGKQKDNIENFSIQDIVEEEKARVDVSDELASLQELVAILKQYSADLKSVENNITKARLCYENTVQWANEQQHKIEELYINIANKVNELNKHLYTIIADAPKKLTVKVTISEEDKLSMQAKFEENIHVMCKQHLQNMAEIRQAFDVQVSNEYKYANTIYKEIHDMLRQNDGFYVSGFWLWVCAAFFWIGVCFTATGIGACVYKVIAS